MRVKLKVLSGSNVGKVVRIKKDEFYIGRSKSCHLRPSSDTVSRKHCVLITDGEKISIEDLKSRNGVYLNGEKIEEKHELSSGDRLKIGKLEFEVVIKDVRTETEVKTVSGVGDTLPSSISDSGSIEDSISGWLYEADEIDRKQTKSSPRDTRQFKMDDTDRVRLEEAARLDTEQLNAADDGDDGDGGKVEEEASTAGKPKKKEPGKLPKLPTVSGKDSREAAEDTLKKFFSRR